MVKHIKGADDVKAAVLAILTAGSLLAAATKTSAEEFPLRPIPIEIKMKWVGKSCNAEGNIRITLKNISQRPITVPKAGKFGEGGMFIATFKVKGDDEIYATSGHGFVVPHYLGSTISGKDLTVIEPKKVITYDYTLRDPSGRNSLDYFSEAYKQLIIKGGRLNAYYALRKSNVRSDLTDNMYFVGEDWFPAVDANELRC